MLTPTNDYEAFILAMRLAITAPTETQSIDVTRMANQLATRLTRQQIEQACDEVETLARKENPRPPVQRMVNRKIGRRPAPAAPTTDELAHIFKQLTHKEEKK